MNSFLDDILQDFTFPVTNSILIFTIILAIILIIPMIMRKIHVPSIIGLIFAGIVIGEYGFGIIANDSVIQMFSTIGLLYIMFMAGLELDFNEFKINKNKSLIFGLFTFAIPLLIGYPICHFVLGYEPLASFLTASMFSTHTLISYPIVSKMGVSKNQAVAVTVGGTILTDATVLILLAIITSANQGNLGTGFWLQLGISLVVFSILVFFLLPKMARWFLKNTDDKYSNYILVLFILFLSGFLAHMGKLEPIIGAFAAGLALNRLIPHSSALMNRIEFFGNSLFIPVFLISVGMIVNLQVVFDGWRTIIVAGALSAVALTGKYLAAKATQKTFKYSSSQGDLIFGLSSAHAAATLAIIIVGYHAGILDIYILNGTIILILFTCIISSVVTQNASRTIARKEEKEGSFNISEMGQFADEKILVPIANPSNIGHHVELALLLKDQKSVNSISLLGVFQNNKEVESNIINFHKKLKEFVDTATAAEINVDINTTIDHNAASGIVRIARETMSDIVILGWPGKVGVLEKLLGEKVDLIIKNMDKNLFICHIERDLIQHKRIVIISPPYAEKEDGFSLWVSKMAQLSQELSIPILHLGSPATQQVIKENSKLAPLFVFEEFNNWNKSFYLNEGIINKDDIIVLISAHEGYISYTTVLDNLPTKLEARYPHSSRIVIYPKQREADNLLEIENSSFIPQ